MPARAVAAAVCYDAAMPSWLTVLLVVVAVLAAGMVRERWRISGLERWTRENGFILRAPFTPTELPPLAALTALFHAGGARRWGVAVEGSWDRVEVTVAEYEATDPGRKSGTWRTLVVCPLDGRPFAAPDPSPPSVSTWRHGGEWASDGDHAAWRTTGTLSASRLEKLLALVPELRRTTL